MNPSVGSVFHSVGESAQRDDQRGCLGSDESHGVAKDQQLRIAVDELTGRAKVDDSPSLRCQIPERMDMRHDIMTKAFLKFRGDREVDVVQIVPDGLELLVGYIQAQFLLRLGERQPESSPYAEAMGV